MERSTQLSKEKINQELQKNYWLLVEKYKVELLKEGQQARIIIFMDRGIVTAVQKQTTTAGSTLLDIELQKMLV